MHDHRQASTPVLPRRGLLTGGSVAALAAVAGTAPRPAAAQARNRFVFANESDYDTVDPHAAFDVGRIAVRLNIYDGLMRWVGNPPELQPWLAESYTVSDDRLTYTFRLRAGAKFHDGSPVEAKDVVYSFDRIMALGRGAAPLFRMMLDPGAAKAIDDRTVAFTLKAPSAIFLAAIPECHVVNARLVQANASGNDWGSAWLSRNSAGSGAFRLTQHDPAVGFVAERFADHFMGWGPRYLDVIEFRGVRDTNTRVLGLIRGDFHGMGGYLQADQLQRIRQSGRAQVLEHESTRIMMMQFMTQRAPLDNVHVRRAINMAFDYDGFNQGILGGTVERNPTPIPNPMWGNPKDVTGYRFDLDGARAELARSGVRIDRPLEIAFLVGFAQSEQAAQLLQNGLTRLGIQSRVVGYPWPTIVERFKDPNTTPDINVYWISTYYSDPHNWIGEMFHSANRGTFRNAHWYSNPELDAILDKAIRSDSREERQRLYEQAVRIVVADAPGLWIYNTKWYGPYSSRVRGISFNPINNGQEMRTVYFEG